MGSQFGTNLTAPDATNVSLVMLEAKILENPIFVFKRMKSLLIKLDKKYSQNQDVRM